MKLHPESEFIRFLEDDLSLPPASVSMAVKRHGGDYRLLPIILWQYGLATFDEITDMFDWLENQ
ncbi:MAG: DUF2949 domain-containing protein [Leptolyngbyaceae cyanobacterium SM2_5_2]|nr:DUF2949 domain-containing protein [Leptolyngbyaceae cyanobacterium SM2_5_2]